MPAWFNTRRIAVAALAMLATCVQAQYTNVWPGWSHTREWREQLSQTHSGVVERCVIAGVSTPAPYTPTIYDRRPLVAATVEDKSHLAVAIPHFVDPTLASDTAAMASCINTGGAPYLTVSQACVLAYRPVNFFAYTPKRSVRGLGPFTNDATVGHPYGWTNEYTAAGGMNYPPGRSCWYTTDYDIEGVKDICSNLWITAVAWKFAATNNSDTWDANANSSSPNAHAAWLACLAAVYPPSGSWSGGYSPALRGASLCYGQVVSNRSMNTMYTYAELYASADHLTTASAIYTGVTHNVDFYGCADIVHSIVGIYRLGTNEFYDNGTGWGRDTVQYVSESGWGITNYPVSTNTTALIGSASTVPLLSAEPAPLIIWPDINNDIEGTETYMGYEMSTRARVVLIRWKGAGQGVVWR